MNTAIDMFKITALLMSLLVAGTVHANTSETGSEAPHTDTACVDDDEGHDENADTEDGDTEEEGHCEDEDDSHDNDGD